MNKRLEKGIVGGEQPTILKLIEKDDEYVVGALMVLYARQTTEEQNSHSTYHVNYAGFNSIDAPILTSMAKFYQEKQYLSKKQVEVCRTKLRKYWKQLESLSIQPLPVKADPTATTPLSIPSLIEKKAQLLEREKAQPLIKITFPFNKKDLDHVRTLPGRKFHGNQRPKFWTCPLNVDSVEKLKEWGFALDTQLESFLAEKKLHVDDVEEIQIPGLKKALYPFQKKGVAFIEAKDGRALIADEQGLGKTIEALAWLQLHPEKRPAIIVVPAAVKLNWEREALVWMDGPKIQVLSGTKADVPLTGDIIIINYDILSAWLKKLQQYSAEVIVLDEVHYLKNSKTKRTKAVKMLAKKIPHVIALSGTPIVNRPVEMYNALKLVDYTVVPDFWTYAQRYCAARHNGFAWDFSGASNTEELHEKLTNTIMLRRLKKDVLNDLPDKIHTLLPIEIDNPAEYEHAEKDFISWVLKNRGRDAARRASNAEAFAQIEALKQLAIKGKMKQAIEWIENFLNTDGKLVVFATHRNTVDTLTQRFGNRAVKVDGSVSGQARQVAIDRFQNDESCRLFVGNIRAAGIGLTLTAASNVAFLELPWTPGELTQAEDRCHRIGQKNAVSIYYLIASGTIDEKIARMLDSKRKVLDSVLDGKETEEESLLSALINEYKGEE